MELQRYPQCQWQPHPDGGVECAVCKIRRSSERLRKCRMAADAPPPAVRKPRPPGTAKKAAKYAVAWTRWALDGMPTRDENQIRELLAICVKCSEYDAQKEACNACGCCASKSTRGWANKLAMATEKCPLGKW